MVLWCCSFFASYYSMRGGRSNSSVYCGKFNFYIGILNSVSNWSYGAALLWLASYYPIRGGHCNDGFRCGILFVSANGSVSLAYWTDGAAL